jgi:hypothetical protein
MNQHPIVLIDPVFKWLDWVIAEYGLHLYMVTVWLSPLLIVWILRGGFWRRPPLLPRYVVKPLPLPKHPVATPPPLPDSSSRRDDDSQSFAA